MESTYECDCCGACCEHLIVSADWLDTLREPKLFAADKPRKGRRPTWTQAELMENDGRCILLAANSRCALLDSENRCTIYPTRPTDCVSMQAGDEQCQESRRSAGLDPLPPVPETSERGEAPCRMTDSQGGSDARSFQV